MSDTINCALTVMIVTANKVDLLCAMYSKIVFCYCVRIWIVYIIQLEFLMYKIRAWLLQPVVLFDFIFRDVDSQVLSVR